MRIESRTAKPGAPNAAGNEKQLAFPNGRKRSKLNKARSDSAWMGPFTQTSNAENDPDSIITQVLCDVMAFAREISLYMHVI